MSDLVGYIIGFASSAIGFMALSWLSKQTDEMDKQEEITRILDFIGVEDEIYPLFTVNHLPKLHMIEQLHETFELLGDQFTWCTPILARLTIMNDEELNMLRTKLPDMGGIWEPDNILNTAKALSKLDLTQTTENAARTLDNFEKYNDFLGGHALVMSPYLGNSQFAECIDRVILTLDNDESEHIFNIVQKINGEIFYLVIQLASQLKSPNASNQLRIFELYAQLYNQIQQSIYIKLCSQNQEILPVNNEKSNNANTDEFIEKIVDNISHIVNNNEIDPQNVEMDDLPSITSD